MPFKEKALAEDQKHLLSAYGDEQNVDVLHELTENNDERIVPLFSPKSYIAKTQYDQRLTEQQKQKRWLETIMKKHSDLQLARIKLQDLAEKSRSVSAPLIGQAPLKSSGGGMGF